jgi:NADPH-ferrihemoprotein reductase
MLLFLYSAAVAGVFLIDKLVRAMENKCKTHIDWIVQPKGTDGTQSVADCTVVFASQTGTAEGFAREIALRLQALCDGNNSIRTMDASEYDMKEHLSRERLVIFLVATFGEGGPPDSAGELYSWLQQVQIGNISLDLSNVKYAVFGLGNKNYEFFCEMGRMVDSCLSKLGASAVIPLGLGDASEQINVDFEDWANNILFGIEPLGILEKGKQKIQTKDTVPSFKISKASSTSGGTRNVTTSGGGTGIQDEYTSRVNAVKNLCNAASERVCMHLELEIKNSAISYESGDHVGVYGENASETVDQMAKILGMPLDYEVYIESNSAFPDLKIPECFQSPLTLKEILTKYTDILSCPSKASLSFLSAFAEDMVERDAILDLLESSKYQEILSQQKSLLEIMLDYPSLQVDLGAFLGSIAPLLKSRFYSISSSSAAHPGSIHITVAVVKDTTPLGRVHHGIASHFLQERRVGDHVRLYHRRSTFKLPVSCSSPVIMIGAGTGIAPFRGFLQQRLADQMAGKELGPAHLFFGCRKADEDYLYSSDLSEFLEQGVLSGLHVAFSREGKNKVYVQDTIRENKKIMMDAILGDNSYMYICGSCQMANDVIRTITKMVSDKLGVGEEKAKELFPKSFTNGQVKRLQQDVW